MRIRKYFQFTQCHLTVRKSSLPASTKNIKIFLRTEHKANLFNLQFLCFLYPLSFDVKKIIHLLSFERKFTFFVFLFPFKNSYDPSLAILSHSSSQILTKLSLLQYHAQCQTGFQRMLSTIIFPLH